jgi:NAD(P)-dependent dehydrogenase (short-subunit alcohol dehydrogenase family)
MSAAVRIAIVTGSNTGIGKETAAELYRKGYHVVMACRSEPKAEAAIEDIRARGGTGALEFMKLDLASLSSVQSFVTTFTSRFDELHVLVNNGGINAMGGADGQRTMDGFQLVFGVNYLGHFGLTEKLLPLLRRTGSEGSPSRVVCLSSVMHRLGTTDWRHIAFDTTSKGHSSYNASKLAMGMYALQLNRRCAKDGDHVLAYAVNPGGVMSDIWRAAPPAVACFLRTACRYVFLTTQQGCATSVAAATSMDREYLKGGVYVTPYFLPPVLPAVGDWLGPFMGPRVAPPRALMTDEPEQERLVQESQNLLKSFLA